MDNSDSHPTQDVHSVWDESIVQTSPAGWGKLVSVNDDYPSKVLTEPVITIGRKGSCTVQIKHAAISGVHCTIQHEPETNLTFLTDQSTNGTWIDGKRVDKGQRTLLSHNSELTLIRNNTETISYSFHINSDKSDVDHPEMHAAYDLREQLGTGAFATVKLAVKRSTGEKFAMKIIEKKKFALNHGSKRVDALLDEVRILKSLDHPNIIKLYECYESDEFLYLVLELVTGGDLFDRVIAQQGKGLPERISRQIFSQIISATEYLHSQNIVHRDLKPENVLLLNDTLHMPYTDIALIPSLPPSFIKLTDFGLSRIIGEGTFMKTLCGTPQYLAPEVLSENLVRKGYDKAVDFWSLGVILYVTLTGMAPFNENKNLIDEVKHARYSFPTVHWKNKSPQCQELIRSLLNADVRKRWDLNQIRACAWMRMSDEELERARILIVPNNLVTSNLTSTGTTVNSTNKRKRPAVMDNSGSDDGDVSQTRGSTRKMHR